MRLKERESSNLFNFLKKTLGIIYKVLTNRKTKIIFGVVIILILFLIGTLFGLFISGFFGTYDNPSPNALSVLHFIGIHNLREIKSNIDAVKQKNIRILPNYIKGQFSNPKRVYIDIGFTDFQRIEYKRYQAMNMGALISSGADYVPAKIRYENKEVNVKLRLKGDEIDHLKGEKWSFRIKVKGDDTIFGMKTFSIQAPETKGYLNEWLFHQALKREGVLSIRYDFIEVVINGKNKGIYALEEHFEKQLIESNNRREGIILKFNEDYWWEERARAHNSFLDILERMDYIEKRRIEWFWNSEIETFDNEKILEDPILSKQFITARSLLENFRRGKLKTSEVFDINLIAKYFAVSEVLGARHTFGWGNLRFYYNPMTFYLEPIGFDGYHGNSLAFEPINNYEEVFRDLIFKDKDFVEKYSEELERISKEEYLNNLFLDLDDEIKRNINIIHKDNPTYDFSIGKYLR